MKGYLEIIMMQLQRPNPMLRYASLHTICRFALDLEPNVFSRFSLGIYKRLSVMLREEPVARVL